MANKKYKLTDGNYWATDGVYDFDQGKTQREVNSDLSGAITALQNAITSQPLTPVLNATSFTIASHNVRYVNGFALGYIVLKCTANYTEDNAQYITMPWTFGVYSAYAFQPCTITGGEWSRTALRNGRVYCNAYTGGINFPSCNAGEYLSIYINLPVVLNS